MNPNTFQFPTHIIDNGAFFALTKNTQWALIHTLRHGQLPDIKACEKRGFSPSEYTQSLNTVISILGGEL